MAYHVYTTKGVVLKSVPAGESDKIFSIFTEDLGLILASAKSVRVDKSKLSSALQDLSLSTVSLVHGKHRWKITSATLEENFFVTFREEKQKLHVLSKVAALLCVLLAGEEKNSPLFEILHNGLFFLKKKIFLSEETNVFESILVLRILHNLGYVGEKEWCGSLLGWEWSEEVIKEGVLKKSRIIKDINSALSASQLS